MRPGAAGPRRAPWASPAAPWVHRRAPLSLPQVRRLGCCHRLPWRPGKVWRGRWEASSDQLAQRIPPQRMVPRANSVPRQPPPARAPASSRPRPAQPPPAAAHLAQARRRFRALAAAARALCLLVRRAPPPPPPLRPLQPPRHPCWCPMTLPARLRRRLCCCLHPWSARPARGQPAGEQQERNSGGQAMSAAACWLSRPSALCSQRRHIGSAQEAARVANSAQLALPHPRAPAHLRRLAAVRARRALAAARLRRLLLSLVELPLAEAAPGEEGQHCVKGCACSGRVLAGGRCWQAAGPCCC